VLVANLLRLPVKKTDEQKQLARLERSLAKAREKAKGCAKARAQVPQLQEEIRQLRTHLDQALVAAGAPEAGASRAELVLERVAAVLRAHPPAGVEPDYIDRFLQRNGPALRRLVQAALQRRARSTAPGRLP